MLTIAAQGPLDQLTVLVEGEGAQELHVEERIEALPLVRMRSEAQYAAVLGHEIGHGFDDQGNRQDGDGKLRNWWTDADRAAYTLVKGGLPRSMQRKEVGYE